MRKSLFAIAVASALLAVPAAAQMGGTNGEAFLKAVREIDGTKAQQLLDANGSTVLSFRGSAGDTALTIVSRRRDSAWLGYFLSKGADADAGDARGETPLLIAARMGWDEGVSTLLARGAKVDGANRMGETPLIAAVQSRQSTVVRALLEAGANPDKPDHAAGYSARDYAKRDPRSAQLVKLMETVKPTRKIISGPIFR